VVEHLLHTEFQPYLTYSRSALYIGEIENTFDPIYQRQYQIQYQIDALLCLSAASRIALECELSSRRVDTAPGLYRRDTAPLAKQPLRNADNRPATARQPACINLDIDVACILYRNRDHLGDEIMLTF
jgi:hypothetical protein